MTIGSTTSTTSTTSSLTSSLTSLLGGLDTTGIVNELMAVAAKPQTALKATLSSEQTALTTLQTLNSQVAALATQAASAATTASWAPTQVSSSNAGVTVLSTGTGASNLTVHVQQVASAAQVSFGTPVLPGTVVTSGSTPVKLTVGTTTTPLDVGDGSLGAIASSINSGAYGVTATTVTQSDGTQRLLLQSTGTGDQPLSLTGVPGLGAATTTAGKNAQIIVGPDTLSSPDNTFTGVSGLAITVSEAAAGQDASIGVTTNEAAAQGQAQSLVTNLNSILTQLDSLTASSTGGQGGLAADSSVKSLRAALFGAVFPTDGSTLAGYGVQTDRYGMLTFDATAFGKAYASNPGGLASALGGATGFATRVASVTKAASDPISGSLTTSVQSRNSEIKRTQASISDWDVRLALRQQSLTTTYSNLQSMLSKLNSQSSWLTQQLNAMNPSPKA